MHDLARAPRRLTAGSWWPAGRDWLSHHDPGYSALRRAGRAAILMPANFALADKVIANPAMSYFVAFGSFAMLLLVDFQGAMIDRLRAQAALGLACAVLIALGTLAGQSAVTAAVSMALVAFVVLFAGVVSSVLASATTALLLAFILPVSLAGPVSQIPERVAGWGLAAGVSLLAISLLWPAPASHPVRAAAVDACRALAARLRAEIAWVMSQGQTADEQANEAAIATGNAAMERLRARLFATPYQPAGLSTDARAVIRLVDELRWLDAVVLRSAPKRHPKRRNPAVYEVKVAAADVLDAAADMVENPRSGGEDLAAAEQRMREALARLERTTPVDRPGETGPPEPPGEATPPEPPGETTPPAAPGEERARRIVSSLDPSFRAQELSFVTAQVAANARLAAAAERRSWLGRLIGRPPEGFSGTLSTIRERAGAHTEWSSSWLQNSLRGAAALGVAVLIARESGVQHGFWVVFGTLAVLRSNALSTGQTIVRAMAGTTVGFVVGGVLVYVIGTNTAVLWALLPVVILFAGLAPAAISFAAGQAAFTLVLLILFNIIVPAGWKIGLIRIEDVAIGSAVSLALGLLFWPRGAAVALGRSLAEAYTVSARYLAAAVAYGVSCCDASRPVGAPPREPATSAAAASRRLDDTFRTYLVERGSKPRPLAEVTSLVTGVVGLRLAADAVLDLWEGSDAPGGDRAAARAELLSASGNLTEWYDHFAGSLRRAEPVPDPLPADQVADGRLIDAVARDLRDSDGHATAAGVRVIWTGDHLDSARRLQEVIVDPARAAVAAYARAPLSDELHDHEARVENHQ